MKIREVVNTGDVQTEQVIFDVSQNCNAGDYLITDTTYDGEGHVSNKLRHVYFFPKQELKAGEIVVLRSRTGTYHVNTASDNKTPVHNFYWNLKETVWNKDGDAAYLLKAPVADREKKKVPPRK